MQGFPKAENLVPTSEEVTIVLDIVDVQANIVETKQSEKLDENWTKSKTLYHHEARVILAKIIEERSQI